jgi:hypothetical protein
MITGGSDLVDIVPWGRERNERHVRGHRVHRSFFDTGASS